MAQVPILAVPLKYTKQGQIAHLVPLPPVSYETGSVNRTFCVIVDICIHVLFPYSEHSVTYTHHVQIASRTVFRISAQWNKAMWPYSFVQDGDNFAG